MHKTFLFFILLISLQLHAQTAAVRTADSLYLHGNYSKAIEAYKTYDQPKEVYDKIAKAYVALGNYDLALANYALGLTSHPDDALLKYDYAKLLSKTNHYKEASSLMEELIYTDYKNPNYHYEMGLVLEQMKDSTAMNRFRTTFDLDKTHQKAIYKIAKYFLVKRRHEASIRYIDVGLDSYASNVELISLKAQNYYWDEDYKNAVIWFEKLIAFGETSKFIHEKLSFCYAREYEYKKAIEQGELSLAYEPQNTNNLYIQAQLYERLEDFVNAELYITEALKLMDQPLDDEYRKLGMILNRQGKYKEAIEAFQKSINENPDSQETRFFMLVAKDKYYKDIATRLQLYEDFKSKYPKSPFSFLADKRITELKEEKFFKEE